MAGLTAREIACLASGDVEFYQGRWWLNIHAVAGGKPFQVDQARKVPVAAQLVDDGFLDWVAHAKVHHADGFLFPQWATAARPGDALHTWVRHQARRMFLTLSLPSLRRSFADALSQAGCNDRVLHRVLGLRHISVLQTFGPTPSDDALAARAVDEAVFPG
jgi:integrase